MDSDPSNKSGSIKSSRKAPSPLQQEKGQVRLRLRSLIMNKEMKSSRSLAHGIILAERQRRASPNVLPLSLEHLSASSQSEASCRMRKEV